MWVGAFLGLWVVVAFGVWVLARSAKNGDMVPTPRGPKPVPTDAELRQARKFYTVPGATFLPTYNDLALITADNGGSAMVPDVGSVVKLIERTAGPMLVKVVLVVPRPNDRFQYVGEPVGGPLTYRLQFDHEMIHAIESLPPAELNGDAS